MTTVVEALSYFTGAIGQITAALSGAKEEMEKVSDFWKYYLEPIFMPFLSMLRDLYTYLQQITGLNVAQWFADLTNQIKGIK
jgi:hypothetical protein